MLTIPDEDNYSFLFGTLSNEGDYLFILFLICIFLLLLFRHCEIRFLQISTRLINSRRQTVISNKKKIVNFLKLYCIVIGNERVYQISAF